MSKKHLLRTAAVAGAVALFGVIGSAPADARDGDVRRFGTCSAGATWKLKLGPRDGGIETEFEVDSNRVGQTWNVKITDNGVTVFQGTRTTTAPSGSFEARKFMPNRAGTDNVVAVATFNGQTCRGTASL